MMKIAVLSDIHGNYPALQTVSEHIEKWQPDLVIVNGDTVNRGPRPRECLQYVQEKEASQGWVILKGNHEDYVISRESITAPEGDPVYESFRMAMWTYLQLNGNVADLIRMPEQYNFTAPDGSSLRAVHASMRSNRDGIYTFTTDEELAQQIAPAPAIFITSHTHRPLQRRLNGTLVVNTGAVGLPFDGDWRAAYAQITWHKGMWQSELMRLEYDRAQADRDFEATGYLEGGGPLIQLVRHELATARSQVHRWAEKYTNTVLSGQMSMAESVRLVWDEIEREGDDMTVYW
ncbi:MAG: metallophosphoesterase [Chloroflexi bacterium]|nr:metallophosphoesterase [Chloroflexota bacterium]MBP8057304.1 metallophosphoesterase [Chloroflexota bacterium]